MTSIKDLENAVINAAIELRRRIPGRDVRERIALEGATWNLITSCQQCNAERHTCPGCGASVGHAGDGVCGNCAPLVAGTSATRVDGTTAEELPRDAEPIWVGAPLRFVRRDDVIRMPGQEGSDRTVYTISPPLAWRVNPQSSEYRPEAAEWREIKVRFTDNAEVFSFSPDMPVEIQTTPAELAAIEALGGWENRI